MLNAFNAIVDLMKNALHRALKKICSTIPCRFFPMNYAIYMTNSSYAQM